MKSLDLTGQKFQLLTIIKRSPSKDGKATYWLAKCACGGEKIARASEFKRGSFISCGCLLRQEKDDISGHRFGRLIAIESIGSVRRRRIWRCACDCGSVTEVTKENLKSGNTVSCGCHNDEVRRTRLTTHGQSNTALYGIWCGMKTRCENSEREDWPLYGGRGISVCPRWQTFENFALDMGPRPSEKHSIDRINVDGNYEPSNCRWATAQEQAQNKRPKNSVSSEADKPQAIA